MQKSLIALAALAACAALSSTAFAASPSKSVVVDTGQALAFNVEVPDTKQTFAKVSEDGKFNSVSVAQVTSRELHPEGITKM